MNAVITQPATSSLYELAANKFVTSLKLVNLNTKILDQLQIPKKCLVYRKISKMINKELIFRDIQSRIDIIKQFHDKERHEAIKEHSIKPGPAAFVTDSAYDYQEYQFYDAISIQHNFYTFVLSPGFVQENKYFFRYISIKIIELHQSKIDSSLIIWLLSIITEINSLKIYHNNEVNIMQNIVEIVKLIETEKITDFFMLACFCNEMFELNLGIDGAFEYENFLIIYKKYFQLGLENDRWKTFSLPRRHIEALKSLQQQFPLQ